jgi:hypothetical protein
MKAYGAVELYIDIFLTSALVGGVCSTSRPGRYRVEIGIFNATQGKYIRKRKNEYFRRSYKARLNSFL